MVLKLTLIPTPKLLQLTGLKCVCCGQIFNEDRRKQESFDATMFGTVDQYALCPVCLQATGEIAKDLEYQRKARVEMYQRWGIVIRYRWNPDYSEPPEQQFEKRKRRWDDE
jgi:hypothetical protein